MSATVIDALVITLGLDAEKYLEGMKRTRAELGKTDERVDKTGKNIEESGKKAAISFKKLTFELLGMMGVITSLSGLKQFAVDINTSDAAVGRVAKNLGVATQSLSAWEEVAKKFGGSKSGMDSTFHMLFKMSQDLQKYGRFDNIEPLGRMMGQEGIDKLISAARDGDLERMLKVVQQYLNSSKDQTGAVSFLTRAGFDEGTINVLRETGSRLDEILAKQLQLNAANDQDAKNAGARIKAWGDLTDAMEKAMRLVMNSSRVTGVLNWMSDRTMQSISGDRLGAAAGGIWDMIMSGPRFLRSLFGGSSGAPSSPAGSGQSAPMSRGQFLSGLESQWGLPSGVLQALIKQEGWKGKDSRAGAQGPGQWMPGANSEHYGLFSRADREDFTKSIGATAHFLHDLLKQYGNLRQALMAYNGGGRGAAGLLRESNGYATNIMAMMARSGQKTDIHIGQVNVYAKGADGKALAKSFMAGLDDQYALAVNGNSGVR